MAQPLASAVDDWCKLLQSRVKEAENYYPIACDEDKRLIDLYLPSLRGTKNPLESLQQCQWKPSSASGIRNYTHSIILHVKDHIHKIPVTEVAKSICGFRSRGIESPKACARCIRLSYQYSPELLRAIETELKSEYPSVYSIIRKDGLDQIFAPIQDLLASEDVAVIRVFRSIDDLAHITDRLDTETRYIG